MYIGRPGADLFIILSIDDGIDLFWFQKSFCSNVTFCSLLNAWLRNVNQDIVFKVLLYAWPSCSNHLDAVNTFHMEYFVVISAC